MSQSAEKVLDHMSLFRQPEYAAMMEGKKQFENPAGDARVIEIQDWTKTWEYREKNFAREALTINPAKACQPLGAVFAAYGFEGTLPFVHGSQGCVAYYRSHFSRHFKEPTSCVSSSMTEDAAVFGGLNNMVDGLANSYSLYKPRMVAVSTTCMAEVIGDDLNAYIKTAKEKGSIPAELDVPYAHTPAFVGSHVTGYDNAMRGILEHFWGGKSGTEPVPERKPDGSVNFIGGFDGYTVGNMREIKRILGLMGVDYTILGDPSDNWDTPTDGEFRMYDGGTKLADIGPALNAKAIQANAEKVIAKYKPLMQAVIDKYRPRLEGKKVMLFVGGLRPRHVIGAYEDLGMEVVGTGYEFAHNDDYQRTAKDIKDGTLIYDDVTGYEFEKFVEAVKPDLVASGVKEKYVFQKMGFPFRQMHSWDYSGPYHGFDGFAIFARDMDMAINSPVWSLTKTPW